MLAVAPSNIAVDNLVERLAVSSPKLKIIRLGHPARLVPSVLQYSLDSILASTDGSDIVLDVRKEMSSAWVSHMSLSGLMGSIFAVLFFRVKLVMLSHHLKSVNGALKLKL